MSKQVVTLVVEMDDAFGPLPDPSEWDWVEIVGEGTKFISAHDAETLNSHTDTVLNKYATELERIYNNRTAGGYTFLGVLASMLLHLNKSGVVTFLPPDSEV